jgi:hypothetical protein
MITIHDIFTLLGLCRSIFAMAIATGTWGAHSSGRWRNNARAGSHDIRIQNGCGESGPADKQVPGGYTDD